ncbi:MAG: carboxypeptidase-like regulatory domain-containing protein [Ignavibacteria bacterium]|nr:carboxypeptidase-like regulatory domain-containing protein [Ignavibacteria bacterium]
MNTKYTLAWMYLCFFTSIMVGYGQKPPSVNQQQSKEQYSAPSLMVKTDDGKEYPLRLSGLHIKSDIIGNIAITTMDMTFFNETDRILEGELLFPLAEGNTVSRFAMELNGTMREGVVVEKAKGRRVFESIVRRNVDPALLEMSKGNIFRARVYPIIPKKNKRIILAYEQQLERTQEGQLFLLPLEHKNPIDSFSLEVQLRHRTLAPDLRYNDFDNIIFTQKEKSFFAEFSAQRFTANRPLTLLLPAGIDDSLRIFTGKREQDNSYYCYITGVPESKIIEKTLPTTITLIWDNSGSSQKNNKALILDALEQYLQRCGTYSVRLIEFALQARDIGKYTNSSLLRKAIENLVPDGATTFDACDFSSYKTDEIILVSDGIQTFGKAPEVNHNAVPITVLHAAQSAEHGYLRNIALASGGQYINAIGLSADDIVKRLTTIPLHFLGAECSVPMDIFPSIAQPLQGNFSLAGRSKDSVFSLTLRFGIGKTILSQQIFTVKSAYSHPLVPRLWAQKKLSELDMEYEKNSKNITALGKDFSLVTRNTSLIVLEEVWDYAKYRIIPPTEEMRKEYFKLVKIQDSIAQNNHTNTLQKTISQMARKKEWYNTDFLPRTEEENRQEEERRKRREMLYKMEQEAIVELNNDHEKIQLYYQKKKDSLQALVIPNSQAKQGYGTLQGKVSTIGGKSLPGSLVKVQSTKRGTYTVKNGSFIIRQLSPGDYILEISNIGYYTNYEKITILKDQTTDIKIALTEGRDICEICIKGESFKESVTADKKGSARERSGANNTIIAVESVQNAVTLSSGIIADNDAPVVRVSRPERTEFLVDVQNMSNQFTGGLGSAVQRGVTPSTFAVEENTNLNSASVESSLTPTAQPPKIALAEPVPTMTYSAELLNASDKERYSVYRQLRQNFGHLPMFYMDAADIFYQKGQKEQALRIISNLAELEIESQRLLRILSRRLLQYGFASEAVAIFREVYTMREEEPQSMRDLALALAEAGMYQEAVDTLYALSQREWDSRFPETQTIALTEMNALIAKAGTSVKTNHIHPELLMVQPLGLRIVIDWDADNCDIDLWVIDPQKEKCYYSNPRTKIGGNLSRDLTGGYGPEEFSLKKPISGTYTIKAHYYGDRQQSIAGPTTITAYIWTNYGTPQEKKQEITLRMNGKKEIVDIGTVTIP